jgi:arylsulfatase A-like enzyme
MGELSSYPGNGRETLTLAAVAGLATGIVEGLGYLSFQKLRWLSWEESLQSVGPEQIWISCALNLLLFLTLGLALSISSVLVWRGWPRVITRIFCFLFFFMLLTFPGRMRTGACAVLALGLAWQVGGWLERRLAECRGRMPSIAVALAAAVLLYAGGLWGFRYATERTTVAGLPAPPANAPNILLVVLDMVRADHLSSYGYPRATTPHLDRLAQEGALFERAYPGSSWSLPSHATMMTGRLPIEHGATARGDWKPLDGSHITLAQELRKYGYRSGGFVANTVWASPWTGLDTGFHHYECLYGSLADMHARTFYGRTMRKWLFPRIGLSRQLPARSEQAVTQGFLRWLDANRQRPFFAFLNLMAVHDLRPGPAFSGKFRGAVSIPGLPDPVTTWKLTEQMAREREESSGSYDSALAYLDDQVGRLREELQRRGLADNTLIIVTSDHGEHLGEQGLSGHGNSLYEATLRVPLILRLPGRVPEATRVATPVSLQSLSPTVLELIQARDASPFPATPLSQFWSSTASSAESRVVAEVDGAVFTGIPSTWPVAKGWVKCLITTRWKLIWNESGDLELYDLAADPGEVRNLAKTAEGAPTAEAMLAALRSLTVKQPQAP